MYCYTRFTSLKVLSHLVFLSSDALCTLLSNYERKHDKYYTFFNLWSRIYIACSVWYIMYVVVEINTKCQTFIHFKDTIPTSFPCRHSRVRQCSVRERRNVQWNGWNVQLQLSSHAWRPRLWPRWERLR